MVSTLMVWTVGEGERKLASRTVFDDLHAIAHLIP
jgi:hypothetical protein